MKPARHAYTLQQLLRDLRCTHPNLTSGGYYLTDSIYVHDWECRDCGFWGDSTCGYQLTWAQGLQAWRDHLIDGWVGYAWEAGLEPSNSKLQNTQ